MPRVDVVVRCPLYDSFRVQQVAGMFDVPLAAEQVERFTAEIPGSRRAVGNRTRGRALRQRQEHDRPAALARRSTRSPEAGRTIGP